MVLLLVFMQLTRDLFAIAKFLLKLRIKIFKNSLTSDFLKIRENV